MLGQLAKWGADDHGRLQCTSCGAPVVGAAGWLLPGAVGTCLARFATFKMSFLKQKVYRHRCSTKGQLVQCCGVCSLHVCSRGERMRIYSHWPIFDSQNLCAEKTIALRRSRTRGAALKISGAAS